VNIRSGLGCHLKPPLSETTPASKTVTPSHNIPGPPSPDKPTLRTRVPGRGLDQPSRTRHS
jgi:hypothetical protein